MTAEPEPIPRVAIWPSRTFKTTDPDQHAAATAWVLDLARQIESTAEPTEAPTDHPNPETGTEGEIPDFAPAWIEFQWERLHWPPPKPGTHESDLCDEGKLCCQSCAETRNYIPALTDAEHREFVTAVTWSQVNRTTP